MAISSHLALSSALAESVVAVDVAVGGEHLGHLLALGLELGLGGLNLLVGHVVGLLDLGGLFLVEAGVLKHQHFAGLEGGGLVGGLEAVGREGHGLVQALGEILGDGLERELGLVALALRTAQVAHQHQRAAVVEHVLDGGQGALNAGVVLDDAILHGHVEIHAHDHALAGEVHVTQCLLVHVLSFPVVG